MAKHNYGFYLGIFLAAMAVIFLVLFIRRNRERRENYATESAIADYVESKLVETPEGGVVEKIVDDFDLIGIPPNEHLPAFGIGFGMGEGIYGTGRNTATDYTTLNYELGPL